jgi:uncharacterized protein (DUF58 family)
MPTDANLLFDSAFLAKLERLELLARKLFRGQLRGEHSVRRRGRGIEFVDFRQYQPGDDFRHIDWSIFSRLDRLFLRLFTAEEDISLHVLLDCSRSMAFGAPTKFDYARRVAAALAFIGLSHLDRVSIAPFSEHLGTGLSGLRGKQQFGQVLDCLSSLECAGATRLLAASREFSSRTRSPGLVVVISDFLGDEDLGSAIDRLRARGHQVMSLQLLAEEEIDPPLDGAVRLVDAETGDVLNVTVDAGLRAAYMRRLEQRLSTLETHCLRVGVDYLRASTMVPFDDLMLSYLRQGAMFR